MEFQARPFGSLGNYKYATIFAVYEGRWLFSRHRERTTWEMQGGRIEPGETPLEAARRELYEESGALQFDIVPLCDNWTAQSTGQVFFAQVHALGDMPAGSEMAEVALFDALPAPDARTYPDAMAVFFPLASALFGSRRDNEN